MLIQELPDVNGVYIKFFYAVREEFGKNGEKFERIFGKKSKNSREIWVRLDERA